MITIALYGILAMCAIAWIVLFVRIRGDHTIWKTKKDFSFNEIDKMLSTQDYKAEVTKYLHKYKSDRRWYEDRIARTAGYLIGLSLAIIADIIVIAVW